MRLEAEVDDCVRRERPGLLRRSRSPSRAEGHLRKAEWNLRAMDLNYKSGFYDWTIVTGYYSMYMAALAALWLVGLWGKDHTCVSKALRLFFVERGRLERRYLRVFSRAGRLEARYAESLEAARRARTRVQYDIVVVEKEDAEWILGQSRDFVRRIFRLVEEARR